MTTIGKLIMLMGGKKPMIKTKDIKAIVLDECDYFFSEEQNTKDINKVIHNANPNTQLIFFSATYPDYVEEQMS